MLPYENLERSLNRFLTTDWVHLERKVAALEAKGHILMAAQSLLIGLMIYAVVK